MTSNLPANPDPNPQPDPTVALQSTFETTMRAFWEKNRNGILVLCVAILLGIIAREGWQWYAAARDRGVQEAYALAGSEAGKLAKFAADHSGHPLAGAALLLLADKKFEARDFRAAAEAYEKAGAAVALDALVGRAKLGSAVSKLAAGDQAAGEAALKAVQGAVALPKAIRTEAGYHLATLAVEAGNKEEAIKRIEEISQLDPTGPWAQRSVGLRASLELGAKPAARPDASPGISFRPGGE